MRVPPVQGPCPWPGARLVLSLVEECVSRGNYEPIAQLFFGGQVTLCHGAHA